MAPGGHADCSPRRRIRTFQSGMPARQDPAQTFQKTTSPQATAIASPPQSGVP